MARANEINTRQAMEMKRGGWCSIVQYRTKNLHLKTSMPKMRMTSQTASLLNKQRKTSSQPVRDIMAIVAVFATVSRRF
jgi:hypothetical protein